MGHTDREELRSGLVHSHGVQSVIMDGTRRTLLLCARCLALGNYYYDMLYGYSVVIDDSFKTIINIILQSDRSSVGSVSRADYGPGSGPIYLKDVRCRGTENAIDECSAVK